MARITRRQVVSGTTALAAASLAAPALAQGYPGGQTIKVVVPYPPGGSTDVVGRVVSERLAQLWKTTVIVENVPGAGANVGMDRVAKGATDGTQILIVPPNLTTNPFLYSKMAFDAEKDIIPLGQVTRLPNLLVVKNSLPVNSVAELIAYAKANPGKLNYASSGIGTTIHLSAELFKRLAGVDMVHVAYRGSASAVNDLMAGVVDVMFDNIPSIIGQVRGGTVRALGITTAQRSKLAPEFVPIADTVPGFDTSSWFGVGVRAGTSQEIQDRIEADVVKICKEPIVAERLGSLNAEVVGTGAAEFRSFIAQERKRWGTLITELKIKAD
jgi:tripartite-type tricarboxylate transporter receptor subunit TctC